MIETLRPNGAGDETTLSQYPGSDANWDKVDDVTPDYDDTYVFALGGTYKRDLYALPAHSAGSGTINSVKVYARAKRQSSAYDSEISIKTNNTVEDSSAFRIGTYWELNSIQYNTNPITENAWTWEEIDALQIGVRMWGTPSYWCRCTQVYVEVDYTPIVAVGRSFGFIIG